MNVVLVGSSTYRKQWLPLKERFANKTQYRVMYLEGKLQFLKKDGISVSEYKLHAKT